MSQQYPPQQPGWGGPQGPGYGASAPQPPKKRSVSKVAGLGCLGILALVVVIGLAGAIGGGTGRDDGKNEGGSHASAGGTGKAPQKPASQSKGFKDCVAKNGNATEKTAVQHVTKVTGADQQNDILDAPEVFTDFTGGIAGPHQGEGKLIASAFASCYQSDNGLVTVYDKDGEILSNGKF